jgi:g-D-glutamyl-meso-diaminopimelate peptidase
MPYTYEHLTTALTALSQKYPFLHLSTIGKSLVGRPIPLVALGEGKKSILYVGTHHALEWITTDLLMRYIEDYCSAIAARKTVFGLSAEYLFQSRTVYIVPMLNPDGVELLAKGEDPLNPLTDRLRAMSGGDFSGWKANGSGVDLNHNYNAGFAEFKAMEPSLGIHGPGPVRFSGDYPESEPETSALCSFIRATDISLLLALHTQGGEIYADYNGYYPPGGAAMAKRMAALCGYTVAKPEPAASYGGLKDWFILEYDRPGFTLECGKGVNPLPVKDAPILYEGLRSLLLTCPSWI